MKTLKIMRGGQSTFTHERRMTNRNDTHGLITKGRPGSGVPTLTDRNDRFHNNTNKNGRKRLTLLMSKHDNRNNYTNTITGRASGNQVLRRNINSHDNLIEVVTVINRRRLGQRPNLGHFVLNLNRPPRGLTDHIKYVTGKCCNNSPRN